MMRVINNRAYCYRRKEPNREGKRGSERLLFSYCFVLVALDRWKRRTHSFYPLISSDCSIWKTKTTTKTIATKDSISMEVNSSPSAYPLYDIVILGASGFTGKYVVREALKFLNATNPSSPLKTLALAGRNPTKLAQTLNWASHPDPPPSIPLLCTDTSDPPSLYLLCSKTKLLLNCVGPFRLHGDPVIAACIETGCDYLDICGEPEFMERMEMQYHNKAVEMGSLVVSACGFDSVPAELGWMFNSRQWVGPATPNHIEAYLSLESDKRIVGNFGTYESAVLAIANVGKLQELRRSRPKRARPVIPGPSPKEPLIDHQKEIGLWAVKLPSADSIVVRRTLVNLAENAHGLPGVNENPEQIKKRAAFWSMIKPAHFGVKLGSKNLFGVFRFISFGILLGLLGRIAIGRRLLLKFPSFFSVGSFKKNGPSEDQVSSASFKMWFVGRGFRDINRVSQESSKPDMEIVTRVMGPEIGYLTTSIILLQCALVLLRDRNSLPKGGVFPAGDRVWPDRSPGPAPTEWHIF